MDGAVPDVVECGSGSGCSCIIGRVAFILRWSRRGAREVELQTLVCGSSCVLRPVLVPSVAMLRRIALPDCARAKHQDAR